MFYFLLVLLYAERKLNMNCNIYFFKNKFLEKKNKKNHRKKKDKK